MPFKAVIFDLDGTLLNTIDDIKDSMNLALEEHGFMTYDEQAYKLFVGNGMRVLTERVLADANATEEQTQAVFDRFMAHYGRLQKAKTRAYDGIPETLDALIKKGVRLAVLSNKAEANTRSVVAWYFPDVPFEMVLGQRDGVPAKPDPAMALEIAVRMRLSVEEILYVGDTGVDMRTAVSAGMFALGVLWGFRSEQELTQNGAKKIINRPAQILELV